MPSTRPNRDAVQRVGDAALYASGAGGRVCAPRSWSETCQGLCCESGWRLCGWRLYWESERFGALPHARAGDKHPRCDEHPRGGGDAAPGARVRGGGEKVREGRESRGAGYVERRREIRGGEPSRG